MKKKVVGILRRTNPKKFRLKTKQKLKKSPSPTKKHDERLPRVKYGKPILLISFSTIKIITVVSYTVIICSILFSLKLFWSSIKTRNHLGYFLNMISKRDGDILPTLQALPTLFFLFLNIALLVIIFKLFENVIKRDLNRILFFAIVTGFILIIVTFITIIVIAMHSLSTSENIQTGILNAMKEYSTNSWYKSQIDKLQIEFQCCGSKKYDEWYDIQWYDSSLIKNGKIDNQKGNTPFSCCSITSLYPCVHHNIEDTGKAYLYTPEQNLSISTEGCYDKLRAAKKDVGLVMIGNLVLYLVLQSGLLICMRFLQTAHCINLMFGGNKQLYPAWLIGCYKRNKPERRWETTTETGESTTD